MRHFFQSISKTYIRTYLYKILLKISQSSLGIFRFCLLLIIPNKPRSTKPLQRKIFIFYTIHPLPYIYQYIIRSNNVSIHFQFCLCFLFRDMVAFQSSKQDEILIIQNLISKLIFKSSRSTQVLMWQINTKQDIPLLPWCHKQDTANTIRGGSMQNLFIWLENCAH